MKTLSLTGLLTGVLLLFTVCGYAQTSPAGSAPSDLPARGTQFNGREFISSSTYAELPEVQQQLMLAEPEKFFIEGISRQVIPVSYLNSLPENHQAHINEHPELFEIRNVEPWITVLMTEFNELPHERRAHILVNLDRYKLVNVPVPQPNSIDE